MPALTRRSGRQSAPRWRRSGGRRWRRPWGPSSRRAASSLPVDSASARPCTCGGAFSCALGHVICFVNGLPTLDSGDRRGWRPPPVPKSPLSTAGAPSYLHGSAPRRAHTASDTTAAFARSSTICTPSAGLGPRGNSPPRAGARRTWPTAARRRCASTASGDRRFPCGDVARTWPRAISTRAGLMQWRCARRTRWSRRCPRASTQTYQA